MFLTPELLRLRAAQVRRAQLAPTPAVSKGTYKVGGPFADAKAIRAGVLDVWGEAEELGVCGLDITPRRGLLGTRLDVRFSSIGEPARDFARWLGER